MKVISLWKEKQDPENKRTMMKQIDHPAEHVVATKATGTLTSFDHENLLTPALDAALKNHEKISWYFEMEDFTGWEPGALWMTSHTV